MGIIREDSGSEKKTVKEKVKEKVRYKERKGGGKQREVNLVNNEKGKKTEMKIMVERNVVERKQCIR